ncbi:hypothetical protein VPH35_065416 [Triticum aestivum]
MDGKYQALFSGIGKQRDDGSGRGKGCGSGTAKSWQRKGDWLCPNTRCENVNFAFRGVCNRCRAARPTDVSAMGTTKNDGKSQTITVEMTTDELKKWLRFKEGIIDERSTTKIFATSANPCGNTSKFVKGSYFETGTQWLIDSGASKHMAGSYKDFCSYTPDFTGQNVRLADGSGQSIKGVGIVKCYPNMTLSSVLHVPSFPINLLSISCITGELNCAVIFFPTWCLFLELGTWKILGTGIMRGGLYYLDDDMAPMAAAVLSQSPLEEFLLHHRRLGHISFNTLGQLYPSLYNKICKESLVCDACQYGKLTRSIYTSSDHRSMVPFQTIHSDVWGPSGVWSLYGYKSFVTFIDCCTRTTWVYVLRNKSDVFECFKDFHNLIKNQYDARVKIFRTDNGTEYVNNQFDEYLSNFGIIHQTSCPGTSQQNGLAERKNRHLLEITRCIMLAMNVPKYL